MYRNFRININAKMIQVPLKLETTNNDWYLSGKIKFLARRVFADKQDSVDSQNYTIDEICSKGL